MCEAVWEAPAFCEVNEVWGRCELPGRLPCMLPLSGGSRPQCSVDKRWHSPTGGETCIHHMFLLDRSCQTHRSVIELLRVVHLLPISYWMFLLSKYKNKHQIYTETTLTCNYLGTESSPRSDFSGLQRTVMTELRPRSHDAVTCVELKEHKHTSGTWTQQKYLTVASSFLFSFYL